MKKALKITGIVVAVILILLLVLPMILKGPIEKIVKREVNNMLDATVDYDSFSLSLISSFPDLRVSLEGLSVVGKGRFETDTLFAVDLLYADVDVMSALSSRIDINSILVDHPTVRGIVTADSLANWDIVKPSEPDTVAEAEADTTQSSFALKLSEFSIRNADIAYIDSTMQVDARIKGLDVTVGGDMTADKTTLGVDLTVAGLDVIFEQIKYLSGSTGDFDAVIEADLAANKYTFSDNTLNFSGVPLAFDGWAQLKDSTIALDLKLGALETQFATILALVPDVFLKDVEGLAVDGSLELYADVKGEYVDMEHIPALDIVFKINDGKIKYPDLPKSLNDIFVDLSVRNPGGPADSTVVSLSRFHFELGSNPFDASLLVTTPVSNATIAAAVDGTVDLNSLKDALPLDSMTIAGIIRADLDLALDMKTLEKEDYERVKALGELKLSAFSFASNDLPQGLSISEADMQFSPKYLALNKLDCNLGKSDFVVAGRLENYLAYALKDGTIKGVLTLKSNNIDCNELMSSTSDAPADTTAATAPAAADTTAQAEPLLIPKNIDFDFAANLRHVVFDSLKLDNIAGNIVVRDGVAKLQGLSMNACKGTFNVNGKYDTADEQKPNVDLAVRMQNIDINSLTNSFTCIDSLLPVAKNANGTVSIDLDFASLVDNELSPVLSTVNGGGSFRSADIALRGARFQDALAQALKNDKYNEMSLKDISINFKIVDGNIVVDPFDTKLFGKKATISGKQGLDQTTDFKLSIPIARTEAAELLSQVGIKSFSTEGSDIPVGVLLTGTVTKPSIKLDLSEAKDAVVDDVKSKVQEKVQEAVQEKVVDKVKEELEKKVSEEDKQKISDGLKNLFNKKK